MISGTRLTCVLLLLDTSTCFKEEVQKGWNFVDMNLPAPRNFWKRRPSFNHGKTATVLSTDLGPSKKCQCRRLSSNKFGRLVQGFGGVKGTNTCVLINLSPYHTGKMQVCTIHVFNLPSKERTKTYQNGNRGRSCRV